MRALFIPFLACLSLNPHPALSQQANERIGLTGIINVPPLKLAGITDHSRSSQSYFLSDGQRLGAIEMLSIDPILATARIRVGGTNELELRLKTNPNEG